MSTYEKFTRHPHTGKYSKASYKDDYFGPHMFGVKFEEDPVVYPAEQIEKAQLKEFWADDVIKAIRAFTLVDIDPKLNQDEADAFTLKFMERLDTAYKNRWHSDPTGGEGAVEHYSSKFNTVIELKP